MAESDLGEVNFSRVLKDRWRQLQDRRRAARIAGSAVVAFYWDGAVPLPHPIRDISTTGVFVATSERWYLGTLLHLTIDLQTGRVPAGAPGDAVNSMMVWSKVVRHGEDGVGFEFVLVKAADRRKMANLVDAAKTFCEQPNA